MTNILSVVESRRLESVPCSLEVDEHVPLRFRSYERPLGASYIRLGNRVTSLLELIVDPKSSIIRGVTVTAFDRISAWPSIAILAGSEGLPVLSSSFVEKRRTDLADSFEVAVRGTEVLVFWGSVAECDTLSFQGRVQFLIHRSTLCGVKFSGFSRDAVELFARHSKFHTEA